MSLAEAAAAMSARAVGSEVRFDGVSTDTRTIGKGQLFVAIRGERTRTEFLAMAKSAGAPRAGGRKSRPGPLPLLVADDTRRGLGRLGRHWRLRFAPAVIAITGSNGKTTSKEMLASILRRHAGDGGALATRGNLNTDIGVPLTLLGLRASHRYCAVELGMNHPGEIAQLAEIARPTIALVNNAQREHLEFMHSVEAVAEENASVFDALPADGVAVRTPTTPWQGVQAQGGPAPSRRVRPAGGRGRARYVLTPLDSESFWPPLPRSPCDAGDRPAQRSQTRSAPPPARSRRLARRSSARGSRRSGPTAAGPGEAHPPAPRSSTTLNANPLLRSAIDVLSACPVPTAVLATGRSRTQGPEFHAEEQVLKRKRHDIGSLWHCVKKRLRVAGFRTSTTGMTFLH